MTSLNETLPCLQTSLSHNRGIFVKRRHRPSDMWSRNLAKFNNQGELSPYIIAKSLVYFGQNVGPEAEINNRCYHGNNTFADHQRGVFCAPP